MVADVADSLMDYHGSGTDASYVTYDWVDGGAMGKRPEPRILTYRMMAYGVALTPDGTVMAVAHDDTVHHNI